ncbi:hypothetical protein N7474_001238 [Penicillium riverlandense]|uniref:uncharacterized protein n=1 Tax=Penicillium riverlandense TaxID=1903569 RepID=UPI0025478E3B|nr:uncharacterized protein N7474_001238 [Penicillium riverlandense]KAJ5832927.1 hypothetical protein N7474_001238 [Penicillium riverlandense]
MAPSSFFLLLPLFLSCLPSPTTAWVFSWTPPDGKLLTNHGEDGLACKDIDNPKGNSFDWDPRGGQWCIYLYGVKGCSHNNTDNSVGYTCKPWEWADPGSGSQIYSYQVISNITEHASSSVAAAHATATDTATSSMHTATSTGVHEQTPTPTSSSDSGTGSSAPMNQKQNDSSSLSGGAIAGIVVGVLAVVVMTGVLFFFLYWHPRKSSKSKAEKDLAAYESLSSPPPPAPMSATTATSGKTELQGSSEKAPLEKDGLEPGQRLNELQGDRNHVVEMEQGTVRAELDGSPR